MSYSRDYLSYVLEQLEPCGPIFAKRMFGGVGLYHDGLFFALIAEDILRFKVDDSNRADYEAHGMGPFKPFRDKPTVMQYYEVPAAILEDRDQLRAWMRKACAVAIRARQKTSKIG